MTRRYTIVNDTVPYRHVGCDAVMATIRRSAAERGWTEHAASPVGALLGGRDHERLLDGCELVVVNGEGTLHDDVPACQNIAHFVALAKARGRRVALVNASYARNSPVTTELLARADLVAFRDHASARAFGDAGAPVVGDLSLQSFPRLARPAADGMNRVAYTDSVVRPTARRLAAVALRLGARYVPVKDGRALLGRPLRLALAEALHRPGALAGPAWPALASTAVGTHRRHFLRRMAGTALLVAGRFHAVVFCLHNHVPFVYAPSNTDKMDWLLADVGLDAARRRLDALEAALDGGATRAEAVAAMRYTAAEHAAIDAWLAEQARRTTALMDRVFA